MIRIVADTNIVVSSTLAKGLPGFILELAVNKKILMVVSAEILTEYEEVLRRPRLKVSSSVIDRILADIRKTSELVETSKNLAISGQANGTAQIFTPNGAGAYAVAKGGLQVRASPLWGNR